jgi:hypothetical protein
MFRKTLVAIAAALVVPAAAHAQATLTPSFNAPRRPFAQSEFGGVVSFPSPGGTAYEGEYRVGSGKLDLGLRGGIMDFQGGAASQALAGFEGRARVVSHSQEFPLDGSVVFGGGGQFASGASRFSFPLGLTLGRRMGIEGSTFTLTPYAQPTAFLRGGNNINTDVIYTMGLGADLRMGTVDARLGMGLGDVQGVSLGAVWVH